MNHNELTRFDLEEAIHVVWGTSQDIKLIWEQFYDGKQKMTEDEMANLLLGIQELLCSCDSFVDVEAMS